MKTYDVLDWYWAVGDDAARVYSSRLRDYVLADDPIYSEWIADGTFPAAIDTERSLGGVLSTLVVLRPIPQGILDGYLDAQALQIAQSPDFALWVDLYQQIQQPAPTPQQVLDHIRKIL
jgi:hypothetical protein